MSTVDQHLTAYSPQFPNSLNYVANPKQEILSHIYDRLKYQYSLISNLICQGNVQNPMLLDIMHLLSRQFRDLTRQEGVLLPVWLADTFCVNCDCIQLLGVTSSVRCKARSKKAKANNQAKEKMKNELVSCFLLCLYSLLLTLSLFDRFFDVIDVIMSIIAPLRI
jgi:hypothetical protein